jgi:hypothetical protein
MTAQIADRQCGLAAVHARNHHPTLQRYGRLFASTRSWMPGCNPSGRSLAQ